MGLNLAFIIRIIDINETRIVVPGSKPNSAKDPLCMCCVCPTLNQTLWVKCPPADMVRKFGEEAAGSVITVSFMTFGPRCVICNRVPLRSLGISRLRISSTGTPTFNLGLSEGAPENSKMLKKKNDDEKNLQNMMFLVNAHYRIYR
ncbi:hypothetical protein AVEN_236230-1 [Araneus ventricosus]|uniref:Uncharacterized protein n=1 Tax=Araneus ventricosus TaxID=182803 RepID=A0A4Y2CAH0_ARAVE|nr:hypothetical protein AVEN_236230-1 [Araneus ventricosus]